MLKTKNAISKFSVGKCSLEDIHRTICLEIVEATGATRASIWLFNGDGNQIICQELYDHRTQSFKRNMILSKKAFPEYFAAIGTKQKINAPDALNNPITQCFNKHYFLPNDIHSLLDFVVSDGERPIGILCCENCGEIKQWNEDHERYLSSQASLLGLFLKKVSKCA